MNKYYKTLIDLEKKFTEIASTQFSITKGITRENLNDVLHERSKEIRDIIANTNEIIASYITPYIKDPTLLNDTKALELQELASLLSSYKENIDTGLAYDIRHALTEYAQQTNNETMYIENMFFKGITLLYLDSSLFKNERSKCFEKIIEYSDRYAEFEKPTRNLIVRSFANYYISVEDGNVEENFKRYDLANDFWENTAKKIDDDFPWDAYFRNTKENMCSAVVSALRSTKPPAFDKKYIERTYNSAKSIVEEISKGIDYKTHDYTSSEVRYMYFLEATKYYTEQISAKELVDFLYSMYSQANDDYSYDNLYKKLHIAGLFFYYLSEVPEEDFSKEKRAIVAKEVEKDVYNYAMHIPHTVSQSYVTGLLANFASGTLRIFEDFAYLRMLLTLTVFRHIPTYVHSVMVGKISFRIIEYLAKHNPESLIGLPGIESIEDVKSNLGEILLFVWYASLVHDIGKIVYSHVVSFYVRKLNDKEFEIIKQHASNAKNFIKNSPSFSHDTEIYAILKSLINFSFKGDVEIFSYFADVALGHHKSCDGSFGYPKDFDNLSSPVKLIIDIVSIADSIDAATDSIGRSYAHEKTLKDMKEDLLSQIETRYNPVVTKLIFENQDLYNAIDTMLTKERFDVYYSCFSTTDFSSTMVPPNRSVY